MRHDHHRGDQPQTRRLGGQESHFDQLFVPFGAGTATLSLTAENLVAAGVTGISGTALSQSVTVAGGGAIQTFTFTLAATGAGTMSITSATFTATDANTVTIPLGTPPTRTQGPAGGRRGSAGV